MVPEIDAIDSKIGKEHNMQEWPRKIIDPFLLVLEKRKDIFIMNPVEKVAQKLALDAFVEIGPTLKKSKILLPREVSEITGTRKKRELKAIAYYETPLGHIETIIELALEAQSFFDTKVGQNIPDDLKYLRTTMWYLHSRACLVSTEILCLLENGYADGAHARWRTLYEMATIASFITNPNVKGYGTNNAERYYLYKNIENLRICKVIGSKKETLAKLESKVEGLQQRFGRSFSKKNGWASYALNDSDNPKFRCNFSDIELLSGYADKDPIKKLLYKMASITLHSGAVGDFNSLGSMPNLKGAKVVGASPFGLSTPMFYAASDLTSITRYSMDISPTWQGNAIISLMHVLTNTIGAECKKSENTLDEDLSAAFKKGLYSTI